MFPGGCRCCVDAKVVTVMLDAGGRRRRRHGSAMDNVVLATARWKRRPFGHQIQIF